jgi:tripartite-type tricarboxylate transporter receptor subunit TctC
MKNILYFIFSMFLMTSMASARENVDVVSRYSPATAVSQIMFQIISKMNSAQEKYLFRYVHIPGANGETAAATSLEYARSGKKVLWFGAVSTFTLGGLDKNIAASRKWVMEDFSFISGVSTSTFAILVSPNSGITNVQELVERLRKRDKIFSGNTVSTNSSPFLYKIFTEHYQLSHKSTFIEYKNIGDVARAALQGEIDFVIHNIADMRSLNPILLANKERIIIMPEVPAAPEVNFDNFYVSTVSALAVPGKNTVLFNDVSNLVKKLCLDKEIEADMHKRFYVSKLCMTQENVLNLINQEKNRLQ